MPHFILLNLQLFLLFDAIAEIPELFLAALIQSSLLPKFAFIQVDLGILEEGCPFLLFSQEICVRFVYCLVGQGIGLFIILVCINKCFWFLSIFDQVHYIEFELIYYILSLFLLFSGCKLLKSVLYA